MSKDFDDLVTEWMLENSKDIITVMDVMYSVREVDDITNEVAEAFLMNCLKEGLKVLESRASQILEMEKLVGEENEMS